jgi:CheY-like chemotaxis protein
MATAKTGHKGLLLLVGTQQDTIKVTQILLEKEGFRVLAAKAAEEAAEIVEKHFEQMRLCILDLSRMEDTEVLYNALAGRGAEPGADFDSKEETLIDGEIQDRSVPILFIAQSDEEGQAALKESELLGEYIVRPYDKADLLDKVKQFASA